MASPQSSEKIFANQKIQMFDHDPDGTSAAIVTPDAGTTERYAGMRDYCGFAVVAMSSALTGAGITLVEIVADDDQAGTNLTVIKTSGAVVADAVGDYVVLECTAEEIAQESEDAGADLRYVAARLTVANAADEAVVAYIQTEPRFAGTGLTATTIA